MIVVYKNFFRNKMVNLSAKSVRHFLPNAKFHCLSLYKENQDEYNNQEPLSPEITNFYRQTKYIFNTGRPLDCVSDICSGYAHPENAKVFTEGFNYIHEEFKTTNEKLLILSEDHFFTTGKVIKELIDHDFDFAYGIWGRDIDVNASIACLRPAALTEIFPISETTTNAVEGHLGDHLTARVDPSRRYIIKHRLVLDYFGDGIYTNSSETMLKKLIEANII